MQRNTVKKETGRRLIRGLSCLLDDRRGDGALERGVNHVAAPLDDASLAWEATGCEVERTFVAITGGRRDAYFFSKSCTRVPRSLAGRVTIDYF